MAVGTTAAIIIGGAALVGAGATVYQAEQQKAAQKKAMRAQEAAQKQAQNAAAAQERRSMEMQRAANRRTPNVGDLLAFEQGAGFGVPTAGGQATPDPSRLRLGKTSLLGAP